MSRVVAIVAVSLLLMACRISHAEGPPPDPSRGETYDGRAHRPTWVDDVKLLPRLMLTPLRLTFQGLGWMAHKLLDWDEVNRVHETIFEAFSTEDGTIGVRPAFQYSISFTPVAGLRFFDRKLFGPATNFDATFLTGGLDVIYADAHARPTTDGRALQASVNVIYNRRNDWVYNGIGYTTDLRTITPASRYAIDALDAGGNASVAVAPGLYFDGATGFGLRRFGNGRRIGDEPPIAQVYCVRDLSGLCKYGTVDEVRVPGFNRGTQFFRAGVGLRADSRDNWHRPSAGALLEAALDWTHGIGFDTSQYVRWHAAVSAVLDLWQRSRTLVIRFEANDVEPIGSAVVVPFSELTVLGGPDTFRGFRPGRFRNFSSVFAAAEYRWPIWMWMDATLFAEYGGVFGRGFEGFALERMKPDVGAGVRLRSSDAFFARAQVAYGWGDGWQFFFSVNAGL